MKRRAVVEIISAIKEQDTRPTAYIDVLKGGEYIYGVRTFSEYVERCGGIDRLQQLRQQEFLLHRRSP